MGVLAEQPAVFETGFDQNRRDYDDVTTLFAEMVNGSMRTPFEYGYDGADLRAQDGSVMRTIFEASLAEADRIADNNPNLAFEVRRRRWEIDEHYDMLKMAKGQLPNTMVVVSDFPPELMDASEDSSGYNVARKQTMLRVLTWNGQRLHMHSQSLDRSNRQALEAIYASLGYQPRVGELLGQRMHVALDVVEQSFLIDKLTAVYDKSLREQYGGSWHAGRAPADMGQLNTYDFVREQHDVIQMALQQKRLGQLDIYGIAATLQERFNRNIAAQPAEIMARYLDPLHNLASEILQASTIARTIGRVFSACGLSVGAVQESGLSDQLSEAGYGDKTKEELSWHGGKIKSGTCVNCKKQTKVGVASWCKACIKC
jgi:hypothetical protein